MLYAVRYEKTFPNKKEESLYQRALSRRLLSHALKEEYGAVPEGLELSYGPHGKPYFADFPAKFSLSHCRGLVCCFLSMEEVGVDCERIRPWDPRLARRICAPGEQEVLEAPGDLTALWTLKESLIKLTGEGFRMGFQNAVFTKEDGLWLASDPKINARSFFEPPGYVVSVCCRKEPPRSLCVIEGLS